MKTVFVGISGGVDSSYAAELLLNRGYSVRGYFFDNGYFTPAKAFDVCSRLDIPLTVVKIEKLFKERVVDYFIDYYLKAKTPNPCAMCNRHIKFGYLLEKVLELGADYVATGHYVRVEDGFIKKARDTKKDQSYFLSMIKKEYIKYLIMPLGDVIKEEIKKPSNYKESQDICFIKKGYTQILPKVKKGYFLSLKGEVLKENDGYTSYTIGQRKGLGAFGKRMYVVSIDSKTGNVVVGDYEDTLSDTVKLTKLNFFDEIVYSKEYTVKLRYNQKEIPCTFLNGNTIKLKRKSQAVPGQIATVYDGERVLLGAEIA